MKPNARCCLVIATLVFCPVQRVTAAEAAVEATVPGRIVRLGTRLDGIVPSEAELEKVADGFAWVEGPVWNRREGYLLFSDIPNT